MSSADVKSRDIIRSAVLTAKLMVCSKISLQYVSFGFHRVGVIL